MMAYASSLPDCLELFRSLPCPGWKAGVYGNWDLMRPWLPKRFWQQALERAGLRLLVNEAICRKELRLFGLDDVRKGSPEYTVPEKRFPFECVLAHNPDTVPQALSSEMLHGIDLILCGHTHGGQIRIPGFGALMCSSRYWKKFEFGLYEIAKELAIPESIFAPFSLCKTRFFADFKIFAKSPAVVVFPFVPVMHITG